MNGAVHLKNYTMHAAITIVHNAKRRNLHNIGDVELISIVDANEMLLFMGIDRGIDEILEPHMERILSHQEMRAKSMMESIGENDKITSLYVIVPSVIRMMLFTLRKHSDNEKMASIANRVLSALKASDEWDDARSHLAEHMEVFGDLLEEVECR